MNVTNKDFIKELYNKGIGVLVFTEYVPVTKETRDLAPSDKERTILEENIKLLRESFGNIIFLSFPGDEKYSNGCLAAGRGFFHINAKGGAEPCPFSPYSDINLKDISLRETLKSPLFQSIKGNDLLREGHSGGCLLFEKENDIKKLLQSAHVREK